MSVRMSGKNGNLRDRNRFDTTEEIPRGKFADIMPLSQQAYLEVAGSDGKVRVFELREKPVIIGRSAECDIRLEVRNVSRKHARVLFHDEEYLIEDLESTNGVFVNGVRVLKCVLRNNDQIEIGGVKLMFNEEKRLQKK